MKKRICAAICLVMCLLLLLQALPLTVAAESTVPDTSAAKAVYFYHVESDSAVHVQNENALLPAASTVKLLSGLIFCEQLAERQNETVVVTAEMIAGVTGYRSKFLKAGTILSVRDLLYSAVCASYNDAYQILAHLVSGSPKDFLAAMSLRARELGLTQSTFNDLIGTADASFTTAAEMATIAKVAYQNELYRTLCAEDEYYVPVLGETVYNRNEMIEATETNKHYNSKCNGMSVGSTTNGGDCIIASASNGKESYICVILGCTEAETVAQNQAYLLANALINWVYKTYTYMDIITPDTVVCTIPVTVADMTTKIDIKSDRTFSYYLPSTANLGEELQFSLRLSQTELEAPVEAGRFVGYVAIIYEGKIIGSVPLYTANGAERSGFVSNLKAIQSLTKNRAFMAGAIFFLVGLAAWITAECLLIRYRHRRWNKYFSHKIDTTQRRK
ncbi:MAG: D-alanyl-D-alanine carboxypeptidase [Clostridia bacterium]|nr:D-alanyl-D-alanine carboxypeptidase [Clostridia bacterium]